MNFLIARLDRFLIADSRQLRIQLSLWLQEVVTSALLKARVIAYSFISLTPEADPEWNYEFWESGIRDQEYGGRELISSQVDHFRLLERELFTKERA